MASALTWLDYNESDAERMRQVLAAIDEKETVDSLGLGVIRDSLADQLLPGVSTIQTRARYFCFVPWICEMLEAERVAPADYFARLRQHELTLIESLRDVEPANVGVIGYRSRSKVKRLPSVVYWNGLQEFGIRLMDLSLRQHRAVAAELGHARTQTSRDDDGEPLDGHRPMWDPELPGAPSGFPSEAIGLTLTEKEADYLADKIAKRAIPSLFSELARDLDVDLDRDLPWELAVPGLDARVAEVLEHARNFSDLMHGAQVLYNILLARRASDLTEQDPADMREHQLAELDAWADLIQSRRSALSEWLSDEEFWIVADRRSSPVPFRTRRFVLQWAELALTGPKSLTDSDAAAKLVAERERSLKGKLARLTERRPLENWNGEPFGGGQLVYRWPNARQLLDDIANPEGA